MLLLLLFKASRKPLQSNESAFNNKLFLFNITLSVYINVIRFYFDN